MAVADALVMQTGQNVCQLTNRRDHAFERRFHDVEHARERDDGTLATLVAEVPLHRDGNHQRVSGRAVLPGRPQREGQVKRILAAVGVRQHDGRYKTVGTVDRKQLGTVSVRLLRRSDGVEPAGVVGHRRQA
jgi:hypothetical protein